MKSKLLSAVAVGTSWEKDGTTFYHQNVEFENGDKGQANSKTPKAIWVIGDEYTYEKKANGKYTNITGMKPADPEKGGGYSPRKLKWVEIMRMARSNASAASWKMLNKRDEVLVGRIVKFLTHEIPAEDMEMNTELHSLFISRMSATKNVLEGHNIAWDTKGDHFLKECMAEVKFIQG
jgi:hypothetical protein